MTSRPSTETTASTRRPLWLTTRRVYARQLAEHERLAFVAERARWRAADRTCNS